VSGEEFKDVEAGLIHKLEGTDLVIFLRLKNNSKMSINIIGDQVHSKSKTQI